MPQKLTTIINNISGVPNSINLSIIKEFNTYIQPTQLYQTDHVLKLYDRLL